MKIPSIAGAQNVIASTWSKYFGAWTVLDHDTQLTVCSFDCFFAFGYNNQNNVAQYPIEEGSFATYNKQVNPFELDVSLVKNGLNLPFQKRDFINTLKQYADGAKLVDVVTPSGTYLNCTMSGLSFEQSAEEWPDAIKANLTVKEMRFIVGFNTSVKSLNASQKALRGLRQLVGV